MFDRLIEGLIKAGFEGNPSDYYKLFERNKLNGKEIQELIIEKTVKGVFFGYPWSMYRNKNGELEATNFYGGIDKGQSWIEGDAICNQFEERYEGIKHCADIYKNPEGDGNKLNEYVALTDYWIIPFSIEKTTK